MKSLKYGKKYFQSTQNVCPISIDSVSIKLNRFSQISQELNGKGYQKMYSMVKHNALLGKYCKFLSIITRTTGAMVKCSFVFKFWVCC